MSNLANSSVNSRELWLPTEVWLQICATAPDEAVASLGFTSKVHYERIICNQAFWAARSTEWYARDYERVQSHFPDSTPYHLHQKVCACVRESRPREFEQGDCYLDRSIVIQGLTAFHVCDSLLYFGSSYRVHRIRIEDGADILDSTRVFDTKVHKITSQGELLFVHTRGMELRIWNRRSGQLLIDIKSPCFRAHDSMLYTLHPETQELCQWAITEAPMVQPLWRCPLAPGICSFDIYQGHAICGFSDGTVHSVDLDTYKRVGQEVIDPLLYPLPSPSVDKVRVRTVKIENGWRILLYERRQKKDVVRWVSVRHLGDDTQYTTPHLSHVANVTVRDDRLYFSYVLQGKNVLASVDLRDPIKDDVLPVENCFTNAPFALQQFQDDGIGYWTYAQSHLQRWMPSSCYRAKLSRRMAPVYLELIQKMHAALKEPERFQYYQEQLPPFLQDRLAERCQLYDGSAKPCAKVLEYLAQDVLRFACEDAFYHEDKQAIAWLFEQSPSLALFLEEALISERNMSSDEMDVQLFCDYVGSPEGLLLWQWFEELEHWHQEVAPRVCLSLPSLGLQCQKDYEDFDLPVQKVREAGIVAEGDLWSLGFDLTSYHPLKAPASWPESPGLRMKILMVWEVRAQLLYQALERQIALPEELLEEYYDLTAELDAMRTLLSEITDMPKNIDRCFRELRCEKLLKLLNGLLDRYQELQRERLKAIVLNKTGIIP